MPLPDVKSGEDISPAERAKLLGRVSRQQRISQPSRKSCGVRLRVRKFAHDCIPTGPPVSSQPHALKGEAAQWVDDRLEEEVQRGQLVRGPSAWGSAPFPTKEMPNHKRARKRRLVVDYRRVNARVKRSTYYCRRSTDVLAAVGSVWYTFVDAVSGFNQIRNTKRAREVLAIVARSGKYLPVGLTFGPVNGPDDFNFVVDRAYVRQGAATPLHEGVDRLCGRSYSPHRSRGGRQVLHGLGSGPGGTRGVRQGQLPSGSSEPGVCRWKLWASSPNPRTTMRRGRTRTTRPEQETFRGLESGGFQGCGFKGSWGKVVRGLFAASLKGARAVSAAFVHNARGVSAAFLRDARGATAVFCSNARGAHFRTPAVLPVRVRSFVSSSVREQVGSLLCRSGRSEVKRCNSRVPCVPLKPPTACDRPAANSPAFRVDSCTVLFFLQGPIALI